MVVGRTTTVRFLQRQEWRDACPPGIGKLRDGGSEDLDRERVLRVGLLTRPARRVAPPGNCLVPAAKGRPGEPQAAAFGGLGQRQQQAADLRYRQGNQVLSAPFSSPWAWSRVTWR